jgi:hypothetical protein
MRYVMCYFGDYLALSLYEGATLARRVLAITLARTARFAIRDRKPSNFKWLGDLDSNQD